MTAASAPGDEHRRAGACERAQTACASAIDRSILYVMKQAWKSGDRLRRKLRDDDAFEDAMRVYASDALRRDPMAFFPEPEPAPIEARRIGALPFGRVERWKWPSGYRTFDAAYQADYDRYEANRTAHAVCLRHDDAGRPVVLCVPTWMSGDARINHQIFSARALYDAGLDVVLFVLPFHGERTPREAHFGGQLFPSGSARRTNEAFGQLVWDLRAVVARVRERAQPVGAIGMSLGGYATALLVGVEPRLDYAVPVVPMVDMAELMWTHGERFPESLRSVTHGLSLEEMRALYAVHCPLTHPARIAHDRRMIVGGQGDAICRPNHVRTLWEHWDRPRLHFWSGGHVLHFGRARAFRAVLELALAPR